MRQRGEAKSKGRSPGLTEEHHCQRQGRRGRSIWQSRSQQIVTCLRAGLIILTFGLFAMQDDCCLIGVGPCYMDLMVQVDDSFLLKYVSAKKGGSGYCLPEQMDKILAHAGSIPKIVPGGSSANTIRALSKLGQPCAYLGQLGDDRWGDLFCNNLQGLGIELRKKPSSFTSRVLCFISPDGQRTFLGLLPQMEDLVLSKEDFRNVNWMHFEMRNLISPSFVQQTLKLAWELGIRISMDLSSFNIVEQHKELIIQLISQYAEITFCNEDEIAALTGLSPEAGCLKLQELCSVGVVTLGNKGCLIGHRGTLTAVPAFPANVIDTTGAGDYFAAGFLHGYLRKASLKECGAMGNRLGSAIVEEIGAELPQAKWELVLEALLLTGAVNR